MGHRAAWKWARAAVVAVFVAPVLVIVGPGAALACSCAIKSTADYVGFADTVAVGELTHIEPSPERPGGMIDTGDAVTYTAAVQTVFKGEPDGSLVFRSASHGVSCGLEGMAVGRDYVFFVTDGAATLCDGTAPASPALIAEVEDATGAGLEIPAAPEEPSPEAAQDEQSQDSAGIPAVLVWSALALGLAAVAGWLFWRRRSHDG